MTVRTGSRPERQRADRGLSMTVSTLDTIEPHMNAVRLGIPRYEGDWTCCATVLEEPEFMQRWQASVTEQLARSYDLPLQAVATTAAACVLDWYAYTPGFLAGAMFHVARRVPRVSPETIAFRRDPAEHWISGTALLDGHFWCLPDDPAAFTHQAHVLSDAEDLAEIARAEVRSHADRFLATYDPGIRLPRRALLGVFFDALDSAPWIAEALEPDRSCLESSRLLLPGGTACFPDASRLYTLTDLHGHRQISRRRVACCESHRIEPGSQACFDCPRTSDERRIALATASPS